MRRGDDRHVPTPHSVGTLKDEAESSDLGDGSRRLSALTSPGIPSRSRRTVRSWPRDSSGVRITSASGLVTTSTPI